MKKLKSNLHLCLISLLVSCTETPTADFTWSPETPKVGQQVQFTNQSTNAKSYSWNLGNMKTSDEENPTNIYESSGTYIIDLTALSGLKSDIKTVNITVIE